MQLDEATVSSEVGGSTHTLYGVLCVKALFLKEKSETRRSTVVSTAVVVGLSFDLSQVGTIRLDSAFPPRASKLERGFVFASCVLNLLHLDTCCPPIHARGLATTGALYPLHVVTSQLVFILAFLQ